MPFSKHDRLKPLYEGFTGGAFPERGGNNPAGLSPKHSQSTHCAQEQREHFEIRA
jgi:hypothetical protein